MCCVALSVVCAVQRWEWPGCWDCWLAGLTVTPMAVSLLLGLLAGLTRWLAAGAAGWTSRAPLLNGGAPHACALSRILVLLVEENITL